VFLSTARTAHVAGNSFLVASDEMTLPPYRTLDVDSLTEVLFPLESGSKRNASWEVTLTVRLYLRIGSVGTQRCGPASYLV
jgi:hypothetical protein